jgi:hypothetical protein
MVRALLERKSEKRKSENERSGDEKLKLRCRVFTLRAGHWPKRIEGFTIIGYSE